jgi:hypothetical protein
MKKMAKEIDLTQYRNLLTLGLIKEKAPEIDISTSNTEIKEKNIQNTKTDIVVNFNDSTLNNIEEKQDFEILNENNAAKIDDPKYPEKQNVTSVKNEDEITPDQRGLFELFKRTGDSTNEDEDFEILFNTVLSDLKIEDIKNALSTIKTLGSESALNEEQKNELQAAISLKETVTTRLKEAVPGLKIDFEILNENNAAKIGNPKYPEKQNVTSVKNEDEITPDQRGLFELFKRTGDSTYEITPGVDTIYHRDIQNTKTDIVVNFNDSTLNNIEEKQDFEILNENNVVKIDDPKYPEKQNVTSVKNEDEITPGVDIIYHRDLQNQRGLFELFKRTGDGVSTRVEKSDAETRKLDREAQLSVFIYNILPYIGTNAVTGAINFFTDFPSGAGAFLALLQGASTVTTFLTKIKYFTPAELLISLAHNFYTLQFTRGITVKQAGSTFFGVGLWPEWDGKPNITYGSGLVKIDLESILNVIGNVLFGKRNAMQNLPGLVDNKEITTWKDGGSGRTPEINLNSVSINGREKIKKLDIFIKPAEILDEKNTLEEKTENISFYGLNPFKLNQTNKYSSSGLDNLDNAIEKAASLELIRNRRNSTLDSLYIGVNSNNTDEELFRVKYNNPHNPPEEKELRKKDILERFRSNNNALYSSEENKIGKLYTEKGTEEKINKIKYIDLSGTQVEKNLKDAIRDKGKLIGEGIAQLGKILVMPITANQDSDLQNFYIPFEFNPQIEEGGINARYQATQILSRIGDLQTYTGTDSLTATLSTRYYALSHDETITTTDGYNWMSQFTLKNIQGIELAYRSLVLPYFPSEERQDVGEGYKYTKPPIIKIIMGNEFETAPYSAILTYQNDKVAKDRHHKSQSDVMQKKYRSFIVTSVSIKKDLIETPLYLNKDGIALDTFGFEVSLSLIEVSHSYMDMVPDFKSYFDGYTTVFPKMLG